MTAVKLDVRLVPGKGRGVFALESFRAGEIIEKAPVLILSEWELPLISASSLAHYIYALPDGTAAIGLGTASLYNHSDTPNASFDAQAEGITISALRPVEAGDEITLDYQWEEKTLLEAGIF